MNNAQKRGVSLGLVILVLAGIFLGAVGGGIAGAAAGYLAGRWQVRGFYGAYGYGCPQGYWWYGGPLMPRGGPWGMGPWAWEQPPQAPPPSPEVKPPPRRTPVPTPRLLPQVPPRAFRALEFGALVREVVPGSPAEGAGIQVGDVITEVDGTRLSARVDLAEQIRKHRPGDQVTLTVERGGKETKIKVTLGSRRDDSGKEVAYLGVSYAPRMPPALRTPVPGTSD